MKFNVLQRKPVQFCLLMALFIFTGCSNQERTYQVEGHLEFEDGSPVKFGTIELLNQEKKINSRGKIGRDGSFTLGTFAEGDGAIAGTHLVTIQQFVTVPLTFDQHDKITHDHGKLVSDKYRTYTQTDLEITIKRQKNIVTLIVESKDE